MQPSTGDADNLWVVQLLCNFSAGVAPMMGDGFGHIAWHHLPATPHREKPQEFYDEIARLHAGVELLDMFARIRRPGWWAYGDKIEGLIQPPLEPEIFS